MTGDFRFEEDNNLSPRQNVLKTPEHFLVTVGVVKNNKQATLLSACIIVMAIILTFFLFRTDDSSIENLPERNTPSGIEL